MCVEHAVHMVTFRPVYTQGLQNGSCTQKLTEVQRKPERCGIIEMNEEEEESFKPHCKEKQRPEAHKSK